MLFKIQLLFVKYHKLKNMLE